MTDTEKWDNEWFRALPVKMKVAWEYLRDRCDHAGIWKGDFGLMSFQIGATITAEECLEHLGDKRFVRLPSGKFFLPTFVAFQYGEELNPANKAHASVLRLLKKEGALEPLARGSEGALDKEKDKDKDLEKEEGESEGEIARPVDNFLDRRPKVSPAVERVRERLTASPNVTDAELNAKVAP